MLYRGDPGYVSSDSQDSDDDEVSQAAYLGRRGGNLAQISRRRNGRNQEIGATSTTTAGGRGNGLA